jgi:hypothetical protein
MKAYKSSGHPKLKLLSTSAIALGAFLFVWGSGPSFADPFKLGAEANDYIETGGGQYPAPQYVGQPQTARSAPIQGRPLRANTQQNTYNGGASNFGGNPLQGGAQTTVSLPAGFLGAWNVQGRRQKVEAMPEFQAGAEQAFTTNNQQIWTITGNPGNYSLGSNTGVSTAIYVDKVSGSTAFIRYQHPVGHTMAQEAIVMSLQPGSAQFNGLERVSIVKEGMPQPRAKVTYQLIGTRTR